MAKKTTKKDAYFLVDYDTGSGSNVKLFYHVGNDNGEYVEEVSPEDIPAGEKIYRTSSRDAVVLFTKQHAKKSNKKKTYLKAAGGKPAIVNGLRSGEVYLTNKAITFLDETKENRIAPFNILVDKYLKDNNRFGRTGKQTVVSVVIRGEENVVLSWLRSTIGEYVKGAHSVLILEELSDEDELRGNVFESFRESSEIVLNENDESIEHVIITELEVLEYTNSSKADLYPIEDEFLKLPKTLVGGVVFGVTVAIAGSTFFVSEKMSREETSLIREERQLRNNKPDVKSFRQEKIRNHISFYIESKQVDFETAFEASEEVWVPNSRIDLIVEPTQTIVRLFSVDSSSYIPHVFADIIHQQEAPEGFTKGDIIPSNNYEYFEVTYTKNSNGNGG
jgi:hypothetical protein